MRKKPNRRHPDALCDRCNQERARCCNHTLHVLKYNFKLVLSQCELGNERVHTITYRNTANINGQRIEFSIFDLYHLPTKNWDTTYLRSFRRRRTSYNVMIVEFTTLPTTLVVPEIEAKMLSGIRAIHICKTKPKTHLNRSE